jgi:tetratricopeptide (TPR) repeat protein
VRALSRFHDLSLVQLEGVDKGGNVWYTLHPVVREYLWGRLSGREQEHLHLRAAEWYREQILGPVREQLKDYLTTENENEAATDVLRQLARQTQDMGRARWAVETGLLWRGHLFAARRWEEAGGDLVNALSQVLFRWGQRDLAKSLLRESIATLKGFDKAVTQCNLATVLANEGHLDEALAIYDDVYRTFEGLGAKEQMAATLAQQSNRLLDKGDYDRAIEKQQASLDIWRELGNKEGQAGSLHQLSVLYCDKEDYAQAMATSRQAEALARKLGLEDGVAMTLHQQGIILDYMDKPAEAFARFQESLAISRRIGDEAGAADSLAEMGNLLRGAGLMAEAIAAFTECLDIYRRLNNPAKMGAILEFLGVVHERQGQYTAALEKYEQAERLYRQYYPPSIPIIERHIARVRAKMAGGS